MSAVVLYLALLGMVAVGAGLAFDSGYRLGKKHGYWQAEDDAVDRELGIGTTVAAERMVGDE